MHWECIDLTILNVSLIAEPFIISPIIAKEIVAQCGMRAVGESIENLLGED